MEGKQKRYRRMKKAGIGLEVIGIRAGLILYWIPKPVEKEFYVSTLEGEVIPVELHLNWQPLIFSPSKLKGYIVLDNEYFYSPFGYRFDGKVYPAYVRGGGYSFPFKKIWEIKWDGDQFIPHFLPGDAQGKIDLEIKEDKDICSIKSNGKDFDMIYIFWGNAEGSKTFYGPAQNAEEAEAILAKLYKDQGQ